MSEELEKIYLARPIEEEDFSFEQWLRIRELRLKLESASDNKTISTPLFSDVVDYGDPIYFRKDKQKLAGYVINIRNKKSRFQKAVDISSALGEFVNVPIRDVWYRKIEDMSDVEIPEELKSISTERLLNCYKSVLRTESHAYINGKDYPQHVVKAELSTREHIHSKEDKKIMKNLK